MLAVLQGASSFHLTPWLDKVTNNAQLEEWVEELGICTGARPTRLDPDTALQTPPTLLLG